MCERCLPSPRPFATEDADVMVMPSNNTGALVRQLGRLFPGKVGLLMGPGGFRNPPPYLPYALDNGAFGAWTKDLPWDEGAWMRLLLDAAAAKHRPAWALVPDVVADRKATIEKWACFAPTVRNLLPGVPLAFAVQDGMERQDVPADADVVFVGGTTEWKWSTVPAWTGWFERVHVGRVNSLRRLLDCEQQGVESCDGTGWFRGNEVQSRGVIRWITGNVPAQLRLFLDLAAPAKEGS